MMIMIIIMIITIKRKLKKIKTTTEGLNGDWDKPKLFYETEIT
jgi:hypothetical protein